MNATKKILFCGDGEAKEWDALLEKHEDILTDIDVLIAPHHGRKSGGNDDFLKILNPKLTLFGNAKSKDLNYYDWINLGLRHLTNNQGGSFILEHCDGGIDVYCQYKPFAEAFIRENGRKKYKKDKKDAWYLLTIN